jgi:hypothetical protein
MNLPNIVHPKIVIINGFRLEIVAYCSLTDDQAMKVAVHFVRNNKLKKSQQKGVLRVLTQWDESSVGLL